MFVSLGSILVLAGALLVLVGAVAVGLGISRRRRDLALRQHDAPMLVMPLTTDIPLGASRPRLVREFEMRPTPASSTAVMPRPLLEPRDPSLEIGVIPVPLSSNALPGESTEPRAVFERSEGLGEVVEGHTVRFYRPADGTLQFLPGRLAIIEGRDAGQEIRFVRAFGPDGAVVTFGRADGPPYRHVQLREGTVSRAHARMSLESGAWRLTNLSLTNPVMINGVPLGAEGATLVLADGDRVEMGEVVFRFLAK